MAEKTKITGEDPDKINLMPISLEMLRANCPFTFNLYIRVHEKFILYVKKGDDLEDERLEKFKQIQKLKEKEVERLYVHADEMPVIDEYIENEIEAALNDDIDAEEKFDRVAHIAQTAIECCFTDPDAKQAFQMAEKAAKGLRKVVSNNPKALKKIFHKRGRRTEIIQNHCKNTAALSIKLAFALGFRDDDLDTLGAAALVHDIGHGSMTQDDIDILFKRPKEMFKGDDKRIYENHVKQSVALLNNKDYVNPKIVKLVETHEEELDGTGYPKRLNVLDPLEQILGLVNVFDKRVTVLEMAPDKAFQDLQKNCIGKYDLKYFKKLLEVLKAEEII